MAKKVFKQGKYQVKKKDKVPVKKVTKKEKEQARKLQEINDIKK